MCTVLNAHNVLSSIFKDHHFYTDKCKCQYNRPCRKVYWNTILKLVCNTAEILTEPLADHSHTCDGNGFVPDIAWYKSTSVSDEWECFNDSTCVIFILN